MFKLNQLVTNPPKYIFWGGKVMEKLSILLIALMVLSVAFFSGCEEQKPSGLVFNSANDNDFYISDIQSQSAIGQINGAYEFDGVNDYLYSKSEIDASGWSGVSFEAWGNADSFLPNKNAPIVAWDNPGDNDNIWFRHVSIGAVELVAFDHSEGPAETWQNSNTIIPTGVWVYLAGTWGGTGYPDTYVNGVIDNHPTDHIDDVALSDLTDMHEVNIGFSGNARVSQWWDGMIDEVRVSKVVRNANWINTSFMNQNDPSSFYIVGVEETGVLPESFVWWNSSWLYRKKITIDHDKVAGDLSYFPVLISLISDDDLANGSKCQNDGDDIVFTDVSGVKLYHEIECFANDTGELVCWVNVTNLSSSNHTLIYMYYGNNICSSQEDIAGTWDDDYVIVCHFN